MCVLLVLSKNSSSGITKKSSAKVKFRMFCVCTCAINSSCMNFETEYRKPFCCSLRPPVPVQKPWSTGTMSTGVIPNTEHRENVHSRSKQEPAACILRNNLPCYGTSLNGNYMILAWSLDPRFCQQISTDFRTWIFNPSPKQICCQIRFDSGQDPRFKFRPI